MKTGFVIFVLCILAGSLWAQQEPQQTSTTDQNQIIDLGVTEIKVKIETPQVQLITKRIKPEFDAVKLDRSFKKELKGENEKIVLKESPALAEYPRIDVDKLLKTLR